MVQCVRTLIRKGPKHRFFKPTYKPGMFNHESVTPVLLGTETEGFLGIVSHQPRSKFSDKL